MFRFGEPTYLYLLLLLPFLAAFYLYSNYKRRKNIRRFGDPTLLAQLMPDVSKYRPDVKFWIIFVAIGLFSVLLARPQFGSKLNLSTDAPMIISVLHYLQEKLSLNVR